MRLWRRVSSAERVGNGEVYPPPSRLGGLGERRELPQRAPGRSPGRSPTHFWAYLRSTEHF